MKKTVKGFEFVDENQHECVLETSAGAGIVRLGIKELPHNTGTPVGDWAGCTGLDRGTMALSQNDVKELLPSLIKFAETGELC